MTASESQEEQDRRDDSERLLVGDYVRRAYRLLSDGVHSIGGLDVAAGVCGTNAGDLRRSFDRDGRRLALDHAVAIGARIRRFNTGLATQIGAAIVRPIELMVFPRVTMTEAEENRRLKARLLAIGNSLGVGAQLVEEALETP